MEKLLIGHSSMNEGVIPLVGDDLNLAQSCPAFLQEEELTDEVVLACYGVDACDYLFDSERDESSPLLTPRGLPAKSDYRTNFSAGSTTRQGSSQCLSVMVTITIRPCLQY
jgi:hypothetical protein